MVYVRARGNIRKPRRVTRRRYTRAPIRRKRVYRRKAYPRSSTRCNELTPTTKFALAQLDPFEPRCLGAKIPDSNTMPSLANLDVDQVSLGAPAANNNLLAIAFRPSYQQAVYVATDAAGSVSWNNSPSTRRNFTNLNASVEAFRPVAHAIRMSSPIAPTSSVGFVHVGISVEARVSSQANANPDWPTTINQMTGLAYYKRFTLASLTQSPVTCINKWIDDTGFRYHDPREITPFLNNASNSINSDFNFLDSWGTLIVMIEGQPANGSTPISFEHLLASECLPKKDAWILGTQAAPNSTGTMSAVSTMLGETDFAHTEAQQETYVQQGLEAFARGASVAGERVWSDVAAPLLSRFGHAAVNTGVTMAVNALRGRGGLPGINSNPARLALT